MRAAIYFIMCVAYATFLSPSFAQPVTEVPTYHAGDRWVFGGSTNGQQFRREELVLDVSDAGINVASGRGSYRVTKNFNRLDLEKQEIMAIRHPLDVGAVWDYNFLVTSGGFKTKNTRTARVVGKETVKVTAGEFDTIKIEARGFWTNLSAAGANYAMNGSIIEKVWYAPTVRRVVKYEGKSYSRGSGSTDLVWESTSELLEYGPTR